jgi:hypothetical protein
MMLDVEAKSVPEAVAETTGKPRQRRWKSEQLPRVFTVRADDEEYRALKKLAEKTGWSLSRLLIEATLYHGAKPAEESRAERAVFKQLVFEVRRVGVNLNQVAHALHAAHRGGGMAPAQAELEAVARSIESVLRKLQQKL